MVNGDNIYLILYSIQTKIHLVHKTISSLIEKTLIITIHIYIALLLEEAQGDVLHVHGIDIL